MYSGAMVSAGGGEEADEADEVVVVVLVGAVLSTGGLRRWSEFDAEACSIGISESLCFSLSVLLALGLLTVLLLPFAFRR